MPARSKRSLAQLGKHGAKKLKVHHPDEAPAPATKRCRYGWPAPVAADAPPPSAHGPVRYARPPDLYESVCALSPTELMYHLYEMPAELANLSLPVVHTVNEYSAAERKERWTQCMSAMSCCFQMMGPSCELWVLV